MLKSSGQCLEQPGAISVFAMLWAQGLPVTLELPFNINHSVIFAAGQRAGSENDFWKLNSFLPPSSAIPRFDCSQRNSLMYCEGIAISLKWDYNILGSFSWKYSKPGPNSLFKSETDFQCHLKYHVPFLTFLIVQFFFLTSALISVMYRKSVLFAMFPYIFWFVFCAPSSVFCFPYLNLIAKISFKAHFLSVIYWFPSALQLYFSQYVSSKAGGNTAGEISHRIKLCLPGFRDNVFSENYSLFSCVNDFFFCMWSG